MNEEVESFAFCGSYGNTNGHIQPDKNGQAMGEHEDSNAKAASNEFAIPLNGGCGPVSTNSDQEGASNEEKPSTQLFSAIETAKWDDALLFLETGKFGGTWGESSFPLFGFGDESTKEDPTQQAKTWIVAKDWWGNVSSRSLPIHAAVAKKAPLRLIQKLIEIYPESIRCKNLDGDLPLHLSFQNDSTDGVVAFLLKSYPEAVGEKNNSGRQPVDYASADACEIIQVCVEQTTKVAKNEEARLSHALELEKSRLTDILSQLSEIRGELDHLRKSKMKSSEHPADIDQDTPNIGPNQKDMVAKKSKSDRKLRLPWIKKKVASV